MTESMPRQTQTPENREGLLEEIEKTEMILAKNIASTEERINKVGKQIDGGGTVTREQAEEWWDSFKETLKKDDENSKQTLVMLLGGLGLTVWGLSQENVIAVRAGTVINYGALAFRAIYLFRSWMRERFPEHS